MASYVGAHADVDLFLQALLDNLLLQSCAEGRPQGPTPVVP